MSSRDLEIKILADAGKAKKEFDQLGREIRDTVDDGKKRFASFSSFAGGALAAIGGAAAIGGVARFVTDSVAAAQDAEASQLRLNAAYDQFPAVGDVAIDTLRDLNSELATKTRFDDDATASGQAVLAQFRLTGSQIEQLTPLLQDYAAKTGKDIPAAAQDLGRAILGNGRSLRAVGINFADTGSEAGNFEQLMGALRTQVGGFAEREGQSAAGQAAILANQFGEVQEQVGVALMPALRDFSGWMIGTGVPALSSMVTWLTENWSWISATGTAVGSLVGAYALYRGGLAAYAAVTGIVTAAQAAWTVASYGSAAASYASATATGAQAIAARVATIAQWALGAAMSLSAVQIGAAGLAIGAAVGLYALFASKQAQVEAGAAEFADTLDEQTGALTENTRAKIAQKLAEADAFAGAAQAGISQKELTDALYEGGDALLAVRQQLIQYGNDHIGAAYATGQANQALLDVNQQLERSRQNHEDVAAATEGSTAATDGSVAATDASADSFEDAADEAGELNDELTKLIGNLNEVNGTNQSAVAANARYQDSLAGIAEQAQKQRDAYEQTNGTLDGFTLSLDQATAAGSANAASLSAVAGQAQAAAEAQRIVDTEAMGAEAATAKYNATLAAQRDAFIASAQQAGYNAGEVQALADKVFALPDAEQIDLIVETAQAQQRVQDLKDSLAAFRSSSYGVNVAAYLRDVGGNAAGGWITGPGTGTSDSILSWLSNGEFVVRASSAAKNKELLQFINAGGTLPGFAGGGQVSTTRIVTAPVVDMEPVMFFGAGAGGLSAGGPAASSQSDRPIYADGIGLIGHLREVAGEEARLVWADSEDDKAREARRGRRRF